MHMGDQKVAVVPEDAHMGDQACAEVPNQKVAVVLEVTHMGDDDTRIISEVPEPETEARSRRLRNKLLRLERQLGTHSVVLQPRVRPAKSYNPDAPVVLPFSDHDNYRQTLLVQIEGDKGNGLQVHTAVRFHCKDTILSFRGWKYSIGLAKQDVALFNKTNSTGTPHDMFHHIKQVARKMLAYYDAPAAAYAFYRMTASLSFGDRAKRQYGWILCSAVSMANHINVANDDEQPNCVFDDSEGFTPRPWPKQWDSCDPAYLVEDFLNISALTNIEGGSFLLVNSYGKNVRVEDSKNMPEIVVNWP